MMLKIIAAATVAVMLATVGTSARVRHHHWRGASSEMGVPGAYGSPGNMTPGYSSTARHKPTDTNGF